jgi:hypothetical protein
MGEKLDPFTLGRAPEIGERFSRLREQHQAQEAAMWLGGLLLTFDEHELAVLHKMGFLSVRDIDLLSQVSKSFCSTQPRPIEPTEQKQ